MAAHGRDGGRDLAVPHRRHAHGTDGACSFQESDHFRDQEEWMMAEHSQTKYDKAALSGLLKNKPQPDAGETESQTEGQAGGGQTANEPDARPNEETVDRQRAGGTPSGRCLRRPADQAGVRARPRGDRARPSCRRSAPVMSLSLTGRSARRSRSRAGGRRIGQGEIVKIEDQIGVRITRLFGQSGA